MALLLSAMPSRFVFFALATVVAGLLLAGFFLEQAFGLVPCPLCILQRILYFAILFVAVFAAWPTLLPLRTVRLHAALIGVLAALGAATAGRQIWLLSLPRDVASGCAVVFGSWFERTLYALGGTADCLDQTWEILWLTIPEWSFLWFGFLAFVAFTLCFRTGVDKASPRATMETAFGYTPMLKPGTVLPLILALGAIALAWHFSPSAGRSVSAPAEKRNVETLSAMREPMPVRSQNVDYFTSGKGFYAQPEKPGKYPGVVMIHEWWGLNDQIKTTAALLASQGYQVLAVDLYGGKVATTPVEAQGYRSALTQEESDANLKAAVAYLKQQGVTKVGSLGWCFGGGKSLELALSGTPLDATVIYYGNVTVDKEALKKINWPVLGIFGAKDLSIPVESVYAFEDTLQALGKTHSINIYPNVGHAFANPSGQNYASEETKDAWEKTLRFLDENLH